MSWNNNIIHGQGFGIPEGGGVPNYANSDDIYLDDRTRPRDEYGFRLQPGRQMDKFDWRGTNKNRYLDQVIVRGARTITSNSTGFYNLQGIKINLFTDVKGNIDIGTFNAAVGTFTDEKIEENFETYKIGNLGWTCKDGNLIIPEDGSYYINYYVEFFYDTNHNVGWNYANLAMLYSFTKGGAYAYQYTKQVGYTDNCAGVTLQDLKKGEEIGIACNTNNNGDVVLVAGTLIVMKLS